MAALTPPVASIQHQSSSWWSRRWDHQWPLFKRTPLSLLLSLFPWRTARRLFGWRLWCGSIKTRASSLSSTPSGPGIQNLIPPHFLSLIPLDDRHYMSSVQKGDQLTLDFDDCGVRSSGGKKREGRKHTQGALPTADIFPSSPRSKKQERKAVTVGSLPLKLLRVFHYEKNFVPVKKSANAYCRLVDIYFWMFLGGGGGGRRRGRKERCFIFRISTWL